MPLLRWQTQSRFVVLDKEDRAIPAQDDEVACSVMTTGICKVKDQSTRFQPRLTQQESLDGTAVLSGGADR